MGYRTWLTNEIYSQLSVLNADASILYMIEDTVIQRLSSDEVDTRVLEVFLLKFKREINSRMEDFITNNK